MTHLSDGEIAALFDGELGEDRARRIEDHLEGCGRCAQRRDELEDISSRLDATLERGLEPPAGLLESERGGAEGRTEGSGLYGGLEAAAAVLVLLAAGALAADAALRGNPVRDLVVQAVGALPGVDRPVPTVEPPEGAVEGPTRAEGSADTAVAGAARPARRGLAVAPTDGELVLRISRASEGTPVRIEFSEERLGRISARGGTFRTDPGRLEVVNPAPGEIRLTVPRAGDWRLEVDGRTVLRHSGGRLERADGSIVENRSALLLRVGEEGDGGR